MLAWLFAIAALAFGALGLLTGFGIIGDEEAVAEGAIPGNFLDGLVWLAAATSSGILAMTLHRTEHHLGGDPRNLQDAQKGMFGTEHGLAYLMALGAIALMAIGVLVGFDVISGGRDRYDGILWLAGSNAASFLAFALHGVRHHQYVVLEERERDTTTTRYAQRGSQPR